jgi:hypothetical protein
MLISLTGYAIVYDVNDVFFDGDSTLVGMNIESAYAAEGAFLVETTGARYEYVPGELKVYQGLDHNKRLLASIVFDGNDLFTMVQETSDHVLFASQRCNIGIYGDSTCVLVPRQAMTLSCTGSFLPDYQGRHLGELLLIDKLGGMAFYPQRYETGYVLENINLDQRDWIARYRLKSGQRVMLAAFPGKPFDWEKSYRCRIVTTYGGTGKGQGNPYGQMPSDQEVAQLSRYFDVINIFYQGLYKTAKPHGPYEVANDKEALRLVAAAHRSGMKVTFYTSLFYHYQKAKSLDLYCSQIRQLKEKYSIDGVYIDGLTFDDSRWRLRLCDGLLNWQTVRRLRSLFGKEGFLIYHGTNLGSPVATMPNVDAYCDVTLNGEGVNVKSVRDDYVQYQVKKYGISNVVGIWYDAHKAYPDYRQRIDALLGLNCRMWWNSYVPLNEPPPGNRYRWNTVLDATYLYYLDKLKISKDKSRIQSQ